VVCEIVTIKTSGDRLQDAPLSEAGGKRLFVKEIEDALLDGRADIAVHSAKDMPVLSPPELEIAAVLPREEPWDAVVLPNNKVGEIPASGVIGTSSIRRVAQLRRLYPNATFAPIRGNLDTRLRKLDEGQYDVLVLAAAGLKRLGAGGRISARLPLEACLPAPGQGAIAVQIRAKDEAVRARVLAINDVDTAAALQAERACVVALGGGCQMPIGALAQVINADTLDLRALVIAPDGSEVVRTQASGPLSDPESTGRRAAEELLTQGAREILAKL
jgi:hydroxymethylbilane synthase